MKRWTLVALSFFSLKASAIYNYDLYMPKVLDTYFSTLSIHPVAQALGQTDATQNKCAPVYQNMIKDGVLDCRPGPTGPSWPSGCEGA